MNYSHNSTIYPPTVELNPEMLIGEFADVRLAPVVREVGLLKEMDSPVKGYKIKVVDGTHPDAALAKEIELRNFVELGDNEDAARLDLDDTEGAQFILLYKNDGDDKAPLGVIRATIGDTLKSLKGMSRSLNIPYEELSEDFRRLYDSTEKETFDITSCAIREDINKQEMTKLKVMKGLLYALTELGVSAYANGNMKTCFTTVRPEAARYFERLGYPVERFNGYQDFIYDPDENGKGMEVSPAIINLGQLAERIKNPENTLHSNAPAISHLGRLSIEQIVKSQTTFVRPR